MKTDPVEYSINICDKGAKVSNAEYVERHKVNKSNVKFPVGAVAICAIGSIVALSSAHITPQNGKKCYQINSKQKAIFVSPEIVDDHGKNDLKAFSEKFSFESIEGTGCIGYTYHKNEKDNNQEGVFIVSSDDVFVKLNDKIDDSERNLIRRIDSLDTKIDGKITSMQKDITDIKSDISSINKGNSIKEKLFGCIFTAIIALISAIIGAKLG